MTLFRKVEPTMCVAYLQRFRRDTCGMAEPVCRGGICGRTWPSRTRPHPSPSAKRSLLWCICRPSSEASQEVRMRGHIDVRGTTRSTRCSVDLRASVWNHAAAVILSLVWRYIPTYHTTHQIFLAHSKSVFEAAMGCRVFEIAVPTIRWPLGHMSNVHILSEVVRARTSPDRSRL